MKTGTDYPTEEEIQKIKEWPYEDGLHALMEYVTELWWGVEIPRCGDHYLVSTVGWSGNEEIIDALHSNVIFWLFTFQSHQRGGHYVFHVKEKKAGRPLVIVESPFAGDVEANVAYLKKCMRDSVERGEAPLASHLLYTQFLDDDIPEERTAGIESGLAWGQHAAKTVVYGDRGISNGMKLGMERAVKEGRPVEMRNLNERSTKESSS